ncbi:MAG: NTP transferase domain-containing protein [Candidatus Omnitrophica bacterium]|nr:NTP transferase domain-containing protein [Candidatus Omnitrophota bacterium]MBU4487966.1 NTP transferase domain-containing protein [Candidatus Omnitrophota bacterium]MCG2705167.1 NTP transferase domain-containing protein [Candidatus Omnitrophota bacterium]
MSKGQACFGKGGPEENSVMKDTACIILAAGRGTRMKSPLAKVLHKIAGKTMIERALELVKPFSFKPLITITGYKSEEVAKFCGDAKVVKQKSLLGSADAVMSARSALSKFKGDIVILYADVPLVRQSTIYELVEAHKKNNAFCTFLTAKMKDPTGYGRVLRDDNDNIARIVEEKEASLYDKAIEEVNVGVYCFKAQQLFDFLKEVKNDNKKGEYYLTDIISVFRKRNLKIGSVNASGEDEAYGINSKEELAKAERILNLRAIEKFMTEGVSIIDPQNTYIDINCKMGQDTVIKPFTIIEEGVTIGSGCVVGPFARLRKGTVLADNVEIGNFVELVRCDIGLGTTIKHHTYVGDAIIGKNVNIGAGTITANYDGKTKQKTIIKDGAFIGSGTIFVAPVVVGKKAVTGAGSVLTKNTSVPDKGVFVGIPARPLKRR